MPAPLGLCLAAPAPVLRAAEHVPVQGSDASLEQPRREFPAQSPIPVLHVQTVTAPVPFDIARAP
jgi:hypothetical protein